MSEPANPAAPAGNPAPAPAANPAPTTWYGDKVDATTIGFWQNKGIDPNDPVAVATKLTEFYRNSEKFVGAPPEEMIRVPKANAAEADIRAYWNRIGVPMEAKDYDLSGVKLTDGSDLDPAFVDMFRVAAHSARVPKDQAAGMMAALIKHMEDNDKAELAERTATIKAEQQALDANWGQNKTYNLEVAKRTLQTLGQKAGMTPEEATKAWDALSSVAGIGASKTMEMLLAIAKATGEAPFLGGNPANGNGSGVMSKDQAKAQIEALKADKSFYKRIMSGEVAAKREWQDLHKIAYAS
jgi:hypothetical protein